MATSTSPPSSSPRAPFARLRAACNIIPRYDPLVTTGVPRGVAEASADAYLDAVVFDTDDRDEAVKTKILEHQLTHAKCPHPPLSRQ